MIGDQVAQAHGTPGAPLKLGDRVRINDYLFQVVGILHPPAPGDADAVQANESLFDFPPTACAASTPARKSAT